MDYIEPDEVNIESQTIIDVRTPAEYTAAHIKSSYNVPLHSVEPNKETLRHLDDAVLVCRTDTRASDAWTTLVGTGASAAVLRGGVNAWQDSGRSLEGGDNAVWSIQRQVQFTAGSLVTLGTILGATTTPWLLAIPGFIGVGLAYAGLSGTCGMAKALSHAPWNTAEDHSDEHLDSLQRRFST